MILSDLQFELDGVIFGHDTGSPVHNLVGLGRPPKRSRALDLPNEDGVRFGREYLGRKTITFEGHVVRPGDPAAAWDAVGALEDAFSGDSVRDTALAVMSLRLKRPGAPTRVVYGRPERFDPDPSQQAIGLIPWTATFELASPLYYDDDESSVTLPLGSTDDDGHIVVDDDGFLSAPIVTTPSTSRRFELLNGGPVDAYLSVDVLGPIDRPAIELLDSNGGRLWRLALTGSVAHDGVMTLDSRPWSRGVRLNGRYAIGEALTTDSWLSKSTLPPGPHQVRVSGTDPTGSARFTFRWRSAHRHL